MASGTSSSVTKTIRYATGNGAKITNMTFSGTTASQAKKDAIDYAFASTAKAINYLAGLFFVVPTPSPTTPNLPAPTTKPGDINGDNKVDKSDLSLLLSNWTGR